MKEQERVRGPGVSELDTILKQAEAGMPAMVSCPSTTEDLHLTAEGYAYVGALRTNVPMLVTALQEAQEEARKLRHWARDGKRVWAHIVIESCNAILGEGK